MLFEGWCALRSGSKSWSMFARHIRLRENALGMLEWKSWRDGIRGYFAKVKVSKADRTGWNGACGRYLTSKSPFPLSPKVINGQYSGIKNPYQLCQRSMSCLVF